jgi:hypothetical protein
VSTAAGKWADDALVESGRLFKSEAYKLSTLFDPYTTREAAEELFKQMPEKFRKQLGDSVFGGVDDNPARYNMNLKGPIVRNVERISRNAAVISGLKVQDTWTKSLSMIAELDKQLRVGTGRSLNETIDAGLISQIPDQVWDNTVQKVLTDVFSVDYTKGKGFGASVARLVESLSNMPVLGFLFPFGRFVNNNLAFMIQYSPVAIFPMLRKMQTRGKGYFNTGDMSADLSKMIVGTAALATLASRDTEKQEQGLQWFQEMDSDGDVVSRQNLAPISTYMAAGRVVNLAARGEAISDDLIRELGDQVGISSMLREAGNNPLGEIVGYLGTIMTDELSMQELVGLTQEIAKVTLGDIGSGFTRPFEPLNVAVGVMLDNDVITDRRQLRGTEAVTRSALRYVENIFASVLGEPREKDGRSQLGPARQDATKYGGQREANPVARLLGRRVDQPQTDIDRLLARVNIAPWTVQERTGIPEWDALMNERITPALDLRARQLMDSGLWKNGNQATRERMARTMLMEVRNEVMDFIEREGGVSDQVLRMRQDFLRLPASLREEAKQHLGITNQDRDLTPQELTTLRIYIEDRRSLERESVVR